MIKILMIFSCFFVSFLSQDQTYFSTKENYLKEIDDNYEQYYNVDLIVASGMLTVTVGKIDDEYYLSIYTDFFQNFDLILMDSGENYYLLQNDVSRSSTFKVSLKKNKSYYLFIGEENKLSFHEFAYSIIDADSLELASLGKGENSFCYESKKNYIFVKSDWFNGGLSFLIIGSLMSLILIFSLNKGAKRKKC